MIIVGSDEVGWGPVAGPLYVVGVAMPKTWALEGLRDSKKLTKAKQRALFEPLLEQVHGHWALAIRTAEQIDRLGPRPCLLAAHTQVIDCLVERLGDPNIGRIIVDGDLPLTHVHGAVSIPKADDHFQVVSAASVIAKVLHDDAMMVFAEQYPQYGFDTNVGYGVAAHMKAIKKYGLCPIHRRSYLKEFVCSTQ